MDLLALADFDLVITHGGLGRASRASGRPKTTLSRRIMELEESLDVRLVERGARALRLTEAGAALHERTRGLLREIAEAGEAVSAGRESPRGILRISAPVLFAQVAMGRIAAGFLAAYPDIRLDVVAEDRLADPVEEGYDVVIRINPAPQEDLVGRCFLRDHLRVAAVPSLPIPDVPSGAAAAPVAVRAVVRTTTPDDTLWRLPEGRVIRPDPVMRVSSLVMARDAVRAGCGAGLLPASMIGNDLARGRLIDWGAASERDVSLWVLHTSRRLVSAKVAAFVAFLCDAYPETELPGGSLAPDAAR